MPRKKAGDGISVNKAGKAYVKNADLFAEILKSKE